jgi:peptidyl-tRNA hydrolase
MDPAAFVLTSFDEAEKTQLVEIIPRAMESITVLLLEGIETAMNRYQKK